jgi:hypothetical protein
MDGVPPCFLLGTIIQTPNGTGIPIELLRSGDIVCVSNGRSGVIKQVFKIQVNSSVSCPLSYDLVVTSSYPVRRIMNRVSRKTHPWRIAGELKHIGRLVGNTGWMIVLENGEGIVSTSEWECVTLGHGIADDPITAHPYWSTAMAIRDMEYSLARKI